MEGYEAPSAEEEAAYERFCADRLPSLDQLELFPEGGAAVDGAFRVERPADETSLAIHV